MSQVKQKVIQPVYSSPPLHGAQLAALVLGGPLFTMWQDELNLMAERVRRMRIELRDALRANNTPSRGGGEWSQLTDKSACSPLRG